jgi:type VI protein secretion system component VasF
MNNYKWAKKWDRYESGEVTLEQLETYRVAYEDALKKKKIADDRYHNAYYAYCDAVTYLRAAQDTYNWAKQGMVRVRE